MCVHQPRQTYLDIGALIKPRRQTPINYLYNRWPVCYIAAGVGGQKAESSVPREEQQPSFPQAAARKPSLLPHCLQPCHPTPKQYDSNSFITPLESNCFANLSPNSSPIYLLRKQAGWYPAVSWDAKPQAFVAATFRGGRFFLSHRINGKASSPRATPKSQGPLSQAKIGRLLGGRGQGLRGYENRAK